MKHLLIILLTVLFWQTNANAQFLSQLKKDSINRVDKDGKKTGYWVQLLDANFAPVTDEKAAAYYRLNYYYKGAEFKDNISELHFGNCQIKTTGNTPVAGQVVALDGDYKFYYHGWELVGEKHYHHGIITGAEKWCGLGGIYEYVDYNNRYNSSQPSYFIMSKQNGTGNFAYTAYYRYNGKKWKFYEDTSHLKNTANTNNYCQLCVYRNDRKQFPYSYPVGVVINDSLYIVLKPHALARLSLPAGAYKIEYYISFWKYTDVTETLAAGKPYYYKFTKGKNHTVTMATADKATAEDEIKKNDIKPQPISY